jgi:hypothetical protein
MTRAARLLMSLLAVATLGATRSSQTFTGAITDDICANGGHAQMRMGPTDAECTIACAGEHDAAYVLLDAEHVYALSDQRRAQTFAGQMVRVVGTLDPKTNTILVESIAAR